MRRLRLLSSSLLVLAFATACTDDIATAPEAPAARPMLDVSAAAIGDPVTFCNPAPITLNQAGAASPYPSQLAVSGISGTFKVTATLKGFSHTAIGDIDMLLVGPGGQNVMLMSDVGSGSDFQNATVTFDDNATAQLPASGSSVLPSGTYQPVNLPPGDFFQGLVGPFGATLGVFGGTDRNGIWKLYIWDDVTFFGGSITNGWCVNFTPVSSAPVANAGGPYSIRAGNPLNFDGTGSTDPDNDIESYAWDFGDGEAGTGAALAHTYANSGTYTATLTVTDADGATDDATASVTVIEALPPGTFCNEASITIRDAATAIPYPSTLTVSGVSSGPFKLTATVNAINHPTPFDLEMLLVGPEGQAILLMSDAGGSFDLQNTTLTFDDDASAQLHQTGAIQLIGSYKPTNFGTPDALPGPAPHEPYVTSLAAFAGTDPNGTWRLFLIDDTIFGGGSVAGGWCVNITPPTNSAPIANAGGPYSGDEGSPITFNGTGSTDPDDNIESYAWDFGDGETGSGAVVDHTYANGGDYTVTLTVTDDDGASDVATASVSVADVAPTATFNAPAEVSEGSIATISLTSPSATGARYAFDCGNGYGVIGAAASSACQTADNGTITVRAKVIDAAIDDLFTEYTAAIKVTNVAPAVTSVSLPPDPVAVNAAVTLGAAFTDAGTGDSHTGSFELGAGGPLAPGSIVESNGSGSMSASVTFAQAGVYTITARVTDDDGGLGLRSSALDVPAFLVVYDSSGSFVTGGWISSPAGAYAAEPTFTGKASFGFVAKYLPGANKPSGNTEFQFKAGDLNFKSTSYEWLVVAAAHAKYKGEGTINGGGSYGFMVTAVDGDSPGGGADGFRIKIWDLASGAVVYDNKAGEGDESEANTSLGGGSIVIHR
jgi:PKD repeat protein